MYKKQPDVYNYSEESEILINEIEIEGKAKYKEASLKTEHSKGSGIKDIVFYIYEKLGIKV